MASQYVTSTIVYTSVTGASNSTTMLSANFGTKGPWTGQRWYVCHVCGHDWRADEGVVVGGEFYCFYNKCYLDLPAYDLRR